MNNSTIHDEIHKIQHEDGSFLTYRSGSGKTVEIYDIVVKSERRRKVGTLLVETLLGCLPSGVNTLWAFTRASNEIAQHFYLSLGFTQAAYIEKFYCSHDYHYGNDWETADAVLFILNLR